MYPLDYPLTECNQQQVSVANTATNEVTPQLFELRSRVVPQSVGCLDYGSKSWTSVLVVAALRKREIW
jgi:hypothetical protein